MSSQKNTSLLSQLHDFGIGPILGIIISLFTVPVTTRILSPEEYGKSALFTSVQSIFLLVGLLGLDQSFVRFYHQKDTDKGKLTYHCIFYPFFFTVILVIATIIFQRQFAIFLFGSEEKLLMMAFCVFMPSLIINRFAFLLIRMDFRGKLYSIHLNSWVYMQVHLKL